ncbi:Pkinase-domain-containing protein [Linderina pennispora]|uniref:Pkinase-domain-containing protein n=1 Tax=Linderina pennispora TaxID=61395 RepID=A0A1Y1VXQ6_9FUNG|nr:Pkinase-domain-containing protein [Linderina pennispora]ORX66047.1 Pkinase-domain-containing protein [Linderina pennispora]
MRFFCSCCDFEAHTTGSACVVHWVGEESPAARFAEGKQQTTRILVPRPCTFFPLLYYLYISHSALVSLPSIPHLISAVAGASYCSTRRSLSADFLHDTFRSSCCAAGPTASTTTFSSTTTTENSAPLLHSKQPQRRLLQQLLHIVPQKHSNKASSLMMESKYKAIKHIGEGAFSSVILALNMETGEKVAIKKMKKRRWKDTAAQAEIGALKKLDHDNIIQLLDVFREDYRSFLVFECMDCDLNELVNSRKGRKLPETVILDITYQVLNGLAFIHENDLFHRDIKPENVLIRRRITPASGPGGSSTIVVEAKIADFGLVHDMDFSRPLTDYISTRWYRAPEVLLNCNNYSTPIDVWAVGTIVAELAMLRPLFPGSNQIDQLRRIFEVLGTPKISVPAPTDEDSKAQDPSSSATGSWYEGAVHARKLGIAFIPSNRKPMPSVMPDVPDYLVQLVDFILVLNPNDRPTAIRRSAAGFAYARSLAWPAAATPAPTAETDTEAITFQAIVGSCGAEHGHSAV